MNIQHVNEEGGNKNSSDDINNCPYAQRTRWMPTSEHLRILKDLYYDKGITSLSAEHIQSITGMLRQFGRIEEKNVFYWFQNQKGRERQKRRLAAVANVAPHAAPHGGDPYNNRALLEDEKEAKIETLPLFPLHVGVGIGGGGDNSGVSVDFYGMNNDNSIGSGSNALSLELTL